MRRGPFDNGKGSVSVSEALHRWLAPAKRYSADAIPFRMAYAVSAASVWSPSFSVIFCLWNSTVLTDTPRIWAISLRRALPPPTGALRVAWK